MDNFDYWIEDLLDTNCCENCGACEVVLPTLNTNNTNNMLNTTKKLNFIEEKKLANFVESKKSDQLLQSIESAEKVLTEISIVANKLVNTVSSVDELVAHLENAIEERDIATIEAYQSTLDTTLKVLNNIADPIALLQSTYWIETKVAKVEEEEVAKSLWFKITPKAGKVK